MATTPPENREATALPDDPATGNLVATTSEWHTPVPTRINEDRPVPIQRDDDPDAMAQLARPNRHLTGHVESRMR